MATTITIRQADLEHDWPVLTALLTAHITWAVQRLREEYAIDFPTDPTDPAELQATMRKLLPTFQPAAGGALLIAEETAAAAAAAAAAASSSPASAPAQGRDEDALPGPPPTPLGIAALRTLSPGVLEVKRMYVMPSGRGRRLGSALLDRLLADARAAAGSAAAADATVVRLDTCRFMTDAHRLYMSRGFVERDAYAGSEIPEHVQQHWRFFERKL